jgi:hypothetical protein
VNRKAEAMQFHDRSDQAQLAFSEPRCDAISAFTFASGTVVAVVMNRTPQGNASLIVA